MSKFILYPLPLCFKLSPPSFVLSIKNKTYTINYTKITKYYCANHQYCKMSTKTVRKISNDEKQKEKSCCGYGILLI